MKLLKLEITPLEERKNSFIVTVLLFFLHSRQRYHQIPQSQSHYNLYIRVKECTHNPGV